MTLPVCNESGKASSVFLPAKNVIEKINARFLFGRIGTGRQKLAVKIRKLLVVERDV